MRALVTGARGFVGRHLVDHLQACGDDVVETSPSLGGPLIEDSAGMRQLVCSTRPDVVYHLAAKSDVGRSWTDPMGTFRTNAEGTLSVLRACVDAGVERVVVASSAQVYGRVRPDQLPIAETAPFAPASPYAASKAAAEMACIQTQLAEDLGVIRVRSFNQIGPGQSDQFVAAALAARIAACEREDGDDAIPVGNLESRRDFADVRDVVRAYRLLVTDGAAGEAYNVCSGDDVAIGALAARLVRLAMRPLRLVDDPLLHRPVDVAVMRGDPTKLERATGWKAEMPLDSSLADVLDDARRRLALGATL